MDSSMIGVEVLEHWQQLKVHGMSLERYLRLKKMEVPKQEVESSTSIQLKAFLRWLIYKNRLQDQQKIGRYCYYGQKRIENKTFMRI